MIIVADTNVFLAVGLNEPEKPTIIEATAGCTVVAPAVLPYEICNALSALYKRKKLSADEVRICWDITRQIAVQLRPVDMHAALDIALRNEIYAYDAYYLACAASSKSPLLTLDRSMRRIASGMGITVLEVS